MLLYCHFGNYMPDIFAHRGYSVNRIAYYMFLNLDGIFGIATRVASTVIILFVLFGSFLKATKGGDYFTDLAYSIFGKFRGGPAKIAIVGSSLFGMVSGSAIANVVSTGAFTIPLMKRVGYSPVFAAAVESVASTGGQIMPPIMGASAFLIMEILQISYLKVILAALIPAVLYYVALFVAVDLEAKKMGLVGLASDVLPNAKDILKKSWLILLAPLLLVTFLAVFQWSPMKAAFWAIVAIFAASCFNSETRMGVADILDALRNGAVNTLEASIICAVAGLIIGSFTLTGLGLKFSNILISMAGGNIIVLLLLTMIASLILGMGMPTVACYVVLAVLVAPALIKMNINPIAAHMFIFYFGIISNITPPVCVAAYAGAGIAKANPFATGFMASRLGIVGFIVPYMFVMGPALLFQGNPLAVMLSFGSALVGVTVLSMAFEGIFIERLNFLERFLLFAAAIVLLKVGFITDLIGGGLILSVLALHWLRYRYNRKGTQNNAA
jgi:TRAP transporter 4TM/12TM fusion protein